MIRNTILMMPFAVTLAIAAVTFVSAQQQQDTMNTNVDLFMRDFVNDPPRGTNDARFDLPMDMIGVWVWDIALPNGMTIMNYHWQECLEMTITAQGPPQGSPLHHMIHDGTYLTEDVLGDQHDNAGEYAAWKSIIAAPTSLEAALGAKSVSVFYVDNTVRGYEDRLEEGEYIEAAIRFIGSDGKLYFQQNATELGGGAAGGAGGGARIITMTLSENETLPCSFPYDPASDHCIQKADSYENEVATAFTPACCGEVGYCGNTDIYNKISQGSDFIGDCSSEKSALCEDEDDGVTVTVVDHGDEDTNQSSSSSSDSNVSSCLSSLLLFHLPIVTIALTKLL